MKFLRSILAGKQFLLLFALAFALFAFFLFTQDKNTIVLKDDGFHPRTLTIREGETVTFKSERGKYFWVASDFHPTHLSYPAFDAQRPFAPGSSYSFTFTESGIYKYHDHLSAFYFGIIRVADENGTVLDDCMKRGGNLECWQTKVFLALADKGVGAAYDVMSQLYIDEPAFALSCHSVAHNVGLASYQFYQSDPDFIFSPKAVACAAGFYHGFMEGFLGASGDAKKAAAVCDKIGEKLGAESPDARLQCYHGIGHGAIETEIASSGTFSNLNALVDSALSVCETAADGTDERYRCASGLFNGIANFYINHEYGLSLETSDPLALCVKEKDTYKDSCYGNMNSLYMAETGEDFLKAASYFFSIPDVAYRESAIKYLARVNAIKYVQSADLSPLVAGCVSIRTEYKNACITGSAAGLLEHGVPGNEYEQALRFCGESALGGAGQDICYKETLGKLSGWYSKEKSESICASSAPELRRYCEK